MKSASRTAVLLLAVAFVTVLLLMPLPFDAAIRRWPKLAYDVENFAHPIVFAILASLLFHRLRMQWPLPSHKPWLVTLSSATLFGAATEVTQWFVGRDASLIDLVNDVLGASFALLCWAWLELPVKRQRQLPGYGLAASALALLAFITAPLALTVAGYAYRATGTPVLFESRSLLYLPFYRRIEGAYPGISLWDFRRDWREYGELVLRIRNLLDEQSAVIVSVQDWRGSFLRQARFETTYSLGPLADEEIRIPMKQIQNLPSGYQVDLSAIHGLLVLQYPGHAKLTFRIREIRLVR